MGTYIEEVQFIGCGATDAVGEEEDISLQLN